MAVYPATGNTPVDQFIPEVWAAALMVPLQANLVLGSPICTNDDYDGEIGSFGDRLHINSLVTPALRDYARNADVTVDLLDTEDQVLEIDHGKYFAFNLDDVDHVQAAGDLIVTATQESRKALVEAADSYVASKMVSQAATANVVEFDTAADDIFNALVDYGSTLDTNKAPTIDRFAVVSPKVKAMLIKHERFIASSYGSAALIQDGGTAPVNGVIGSIAGFVCLMSQNLPAGIEMIVGSRVATTYGQQLVEIESLRDPKRFADIVRGLHVAGARVVRPEALIVAKTPSP